MFKSSRQAKSAFALLLVLAALIVPLYTVAPASATTSNFYGGSMPSNEGGIILSLTYDIFSFNGGTGSVSLMQGSTVICNMSVSVGPAGFSATGVTRVGPPLYIYQNLTAGGSYTFVYVNNGVILSNVYVTFSPLWRVTYSASGLSSIVGSSTAILVDGITVPYSALPYTTYVPDGNATSYTYSALMNGTSGSQFALVGTTPASPQTVTTAIDVTGSYLPYSSTSIYHVNIKGPYFEDGSIATGNTATYSLLYVNGTTYTGSLTSTGSVGSINLTSLSPFAQLTWNATSVSSTFNATRVFTFANGQNGINDATVYLFILNPAKPAYQYTFSITDFYGMVNPYLQSALSPTGNGTQVVERVNLKDGGGFVTFVMQQYQLYTLTFICQQGTYSQTFTPTLLGAPGQNPVSLSVLAGNFPSTNITTGISYTANRTSSSTIMTTYSDSSGNTTSINVQISHSQGTQTITDYSNTASSSSGVFTWSQASANTNYNVVITTIANGVTSTYWVAIPSAVGSNPWAAVDWSNLGKYIPTLPATYTGIGKHIYKPSFVKTES